MRHVRLTCVNHPELRWQCKSIAVNSQGQYNGARNIFFLGQKVANSPYEHFDCLEVIEGKLIKECECSPNDLRFAPEELKRQKTEPLTD